MLRLRSRWRRKRILRGEGVARGVLEHSPLPTTSIRTRAGAEAEQPRYTTFLTLSMLFHEQDRICEFTS